MKRLIGIATFLLLTVASFALATPLPALMAFAPMAAPWSQSLALNDLLWTQGKDNLAGVVGEVYACPAEDIATVPALTAATSLAIGATDITCKSGKKFSRVYFTDETAMYQPKTIGERDGKGRESTLTGRYPALGVELEDFIRQYQNTPVVLIFKLARTGKYYVLGLSQLDISSTTLTLDIPCYFETSEGSSGDKRESQNGSTITWRYAGAHGAIQYGGTVPLTPAE